MTSTTTLQEVFDEAEPGTQCVITSYRRANVNLRTQLQRILKRAGLKPWPRLFQNLRSSRESELACEYPLHIVTAWIGNTARIAERHYLQVPDEFFDKAAQNPAQYPAAQGSKGQKSTVEKDSINADFPLVTATCDPVQIAKVEAGGFEPPSRDASRQASTCLVV